MVSEEIILENISRIKKSLESGDILDLKQSIYHFNEISSFNSNNLEFDNEKNKKIEENFHEILSIFLHSRNFYYFKLLIDNSSSLDIFIDLNKIHDRFEILSEIHINGIRTGQIASFFDVIRFYNENDLLKRPLSKEDIKFVEKIKKNKLIISNLKDIFGRISDYLIHYAFKSMTENIFHFFSSYLNTTEFPGDEINFYLSNEYMMRFFDRYTMYGLSIENLGPVEKFLELYKTNLLISKNKKKNEDLKLIEFEFQRRTHLVSVNNIEINENKILNKKRDYNYFSLSMVLLGGLGPQGHGFTYSTPKGEVVEVCSDRKESEAIIVKYKEFLKQQFLKKLRKKMVKKLVEEKTIDLIINFLTEILNPKEKVSYLKKDHMLQQINQFLSNFQDQQHLKKTDVQVLMNKISNAITIILRPIDLIDQFKTRMDLLEEGKIKSEDIAKLTSLKDKSHYDVLRERFFFQNQIKWFYSLYADEIAELTKSK